MNPEDLWFNTPDSPTLCRGGSNGPNHPSQLYAIRKYVEPLALKENRILTFLDYGCGSATTLEAIRKNGYNGVIDYTGLDIIPKNIEWCKENFPGTDFRVNKTIHEIYQPDKSFDVVYSRHVVDHMESFEKALDEHKRVAKKLVIVVLWVGLSNQDEHEIKNIDYRPSGGKLYPNEYTNIYSDKKVTEYLNSDPEWKLLEFNKDVQGDQVIVLRRKDA